MRDRDGSSRSIVAIEADARLATERLFINGFSTEVLDVLPERLRWELRGRIGDL